MAKTLRITISAIFLLSSVMKAVNINSFVMETRLYMDAYLWDLKSVMSSFETIRMEMVAAIASVGLGSYKAYGSYTAANISDDDLLMAENIEAISQMIENSSATYRRKENVLPCYAYKTQKVRCLGSGENHSDLYHGWYEQSGFHYTCKTCTYIPSPWSSKPMDECDSNQQCESGTVESIPDGWTNGAPQQVVAGHDEL